MAAFSDQHADEEINPWHEQKQQEYTFLSYVFYRQEILDLFFSWIFVSLAVATAYFGYTGWKPFALMLGISLATVGIGVLFHELGHKIVAQFFGFKAQFIAYRTMLWIGLLLSIFGIVFLAPGAVYLHGHINKKERGKIALAGPLTNLLLATVFLAFKGTFILGDVDVFLFGFWINALLALFNMIPFFIFDGKKVWDWNKPIYFVVTGIATIYNFLYYLVFLPK
ncbi:MAG: M50 family metallopeptidase [Candidatus Woesearchaeota archaeon]